MEKIILAVDATPLNKHTLNFACYLASLTKSKLVGIFLENVVGQGAPSLKSIYGGQYVETILAADIDENRTRMSVCEGNIQSFEEVCKSRCIIPYIHRNTGAPVNEVVRETRFAHLLIVDAQLTVANKPDGALSGFLKEILAKSECPVVIAPPDFTEIEEIVFAYDGSASSVFAMKQFSYLFSELSECRLMIVQVNSKEKVPVIEREKIGELLQMHYSAIGYHYLQGKASEELYRYMVNKKNTFIVMGAFGRNQLSIFLKQSAAELLIKKVNLPLFIAHH